MTSPSSAVEEEAPGESSVGRALVSGLIGAVVSLVCILPPILHLVTGPLGPFIGGFVAASRVRPGPRSQAIVAITVASGLAGFVGAGLSIASSLAAPGELPDWFPTTSSRILVMVSIVWAYAGTLATIGTVVRSAVGRNQSSTSSESSEEV